MMDRRDFIVRSAAAACGFGLAPRIGIAQSMPQSPKPLFLISLAQWSIHRGLESKSIDPLDFARIAKQDHDIDAIEYVSTFYKANATNSEYLRQLKQRADDHGVRSMLIMCDDEGDLGDPDSRKRQTAVENHHKWVQAAKFLGCHSIRVNARSKGSPEEQQKLVVDGLSKLTDFGAQHDINIIVENHGGLSSNGAWLVSVIKAVNHPRCGTLPDLGNFRIGKKPDGSDELYDRYQGVQEMMPFAKAVSAKSYDFDSAGNETTIDYRRMLRIVLDAGYHARLGIEYEGQRLSEPDGIRATKALLEKIREELSADPRYRPS